MRKYSLVFGMVFSFSAMAEALFPGATAEANDYAFLIGKWDCTYQQMDKQNKVIFEAPCTWQADYAFDNKMVVDDFKMYDKDGKVSYGGRTLRTYSPRDKQWHQVFLAAQLGAPMNPFTAQKVEGEMQLQVEMRQPSGELSPARFSFSKISESSFTWENHRSQDQGKTWVLESRITAKRQTS